MQCTRFLFRGVLLSSTALLFAPKRAKVGSLPPESLASRFPSFSRQWVRATSNKLLQPHHVAPDSLKLVEWKCPHCEEQFKERVDRYVASGGMCPSCEKKAPLGEVPRRKRSAVDLLGEEKAVKSVSDGNYLTHNERRNLQPMLAKNYDKEGTKISFTGGETVMISPKLDGIRCIVTFDKQNQQILFFSRAGTLFDCCDALIEPHLRHLFEMDESLVLDGELYNDFANQKRIRHYLQHRPKNSANDSPFDRVFPKLCRKPTTGKNGREKLYQDISFEQLVSAIRTTRGKRTEEVAAKQGLLQYHIFDVMYSSQFVESPTLDGSHYPFSHRYNLLLSMLADLAKYNKKHLGKSVYDATVIQPVPALVAENEEQVEAALGTAMQVGFEGIMVRREGSATDSPKRSVKRSRRSSSAGVFGGYECGKRSSSLLKYKKMQDDEFIIVGAVEGKGKLKGRLGAFVCQAKKNKGLTFTVTPATTEQKKKEMWSVWSKSYKGKALTVQYQDLTPDGIPRFPVGKCIRGAASGEDWI